MDKNKIYTSLGANYVRDIVFFFIQPIDLQTVERTPENIGNSQAYNLNISFPITIISSWEMQVNLLGTYSQMQYSYQGTPLAVKQVSGRINSTNSILLGKGWTAELTGWLNTPSINAIFHTA